MNQFNQVRKMVPDFYDAIKQGHDDSVNPRHFGHGLDHDVTVATIAYEIVTSGPRDKLMAWCAAMLHSTDCVVYENITTDPEEHELATLNQIKLYAEKLPFGIFTKPDINDIVMSAFRHAELNQDDQSATQIALMDADRLANMQMAVVIRAGQSMPRHPVFEFGFLSGKANPETTYHRPKSVIDNLRMNISEYTRQLRIEKAKTLGAVYAARLEQFISMLEDDYRSLNLDGIEL